MKDDLQRPDDFDQDYVANVSLSYEYYEKSLQEFRDTSNTTNTQLGLLIGFNLTFIRFFLNELPDSSQIIDCLLCNSALVLKLLAYLFAGASIILCFRGLYISTGEYLIIPPDILLPQCDRASNTAFKLGIIKTWQEKLKDFLDLSKQKKKLLKLSIWQLAVAIAFAIADQGIAFFFS